MNLRGCQSRPRTTRNQSEMTDRVDLNSLLRTLHTIDSRCRRVIVELHPHLNATLALRSLTERWMSNPYAYWYKTMIGLSS